MKRLFASTFLPLLLFTDILGSVQCVEEQPNNGNSLRRAESSQQQDALEDHHRRLRQLETAKGARLITKFHDKRGKRLVEQCASEIIQETDQGEEGMIIMTGNGTCMSIFENETDIEASFDFPVQAFGNVRGTSSVSSTRTRTRDLNEVTPWGLQMIKADQLAMGPNKIKICIADTGIALGHPDFDSSRITGVDGDRFWGEPWKWNLDKSGHGTHVAGTLAAMKGNDIGVQGAGRFDVFITRGISDQGSGYESDVRNAINQCIDAKASIINLSLGSPYMSYLTDRLLQEVVNEKGVMLIAASGNDGTRTDKYPASHPTVISVGAVHQWGTRWGGSNFNKQVELAAPGSKILSTSVTTSQVQLKDKVAAQDNGSIKGFYVNGASHASATGDLVYCANGAKKCKQAKTNICLMVHEGGTSIEDMLQICQDSDGIGAIIFDADNKDQSNWSVSYSSIPALGVDQDTGVDLIFNRLGKQVTIGDNIDNNGLTYTYTELSGTSMAAMHVTAAAALVWSHFGPKCTNHQIRYALAQTAQNPPGETKDCTDQYGYGIVDALGAYQWLQKNDCTTWKVPTENLSQGGCTTLPIAQ